MSKIKRLISKLLAWLRMILTMPAQPDMKKLKTLHCKKTDLQYIFCSNVVCHIPSLDGYFCECRKHTSQSDYAKSITENYYSVIHEHDSTAKNDKATVLKSLDKPENVNMFMNMGENRIGSKTPCAEFVTTGNAGLIGIEGDCADEAWVQRMRGFAGRYAWCEVLSYKINRYVGRNKYQTRVASRVVGTSAVAELLGLSDLIPPVEYVYLKIDDLDEAEPRLGTFMNTADGICAMDIAYETRHGRITPKFQKALLNLNLLDAVCYEGDHSPNNYNVVLDDEGMAVGLSVFDNNGSSTFSIKSDVEFESYKGCSPFVKDGYINRPHLSKELALKVKTITKKEVCEALREYLNSYQINSTWKRIEKIKRAIEKTEKAKSDFLLSDDEWTNNTLNDELGGGKIWKNIFAILP